MLTFHLHNKRAS